MASSKAFSSDLNVESFLFFLVFGRSIEHPSAQFDPGLYCVYCPSSCCKFCPSSCRKFCPSSCSKDQRIGFHSMEQPTLSEWLTLPMSNQAEDYNRLYRRKATLIESTRFLRRESHQTRLYPKNGTSPETYVEKPYLFYCKIKERKFHQKIVKLNDRLYFWEQKSQILNFQLEERS